MLNTKTMIAIGKLIATQARNRAAEENAEANEIIDLAPLLEIWKPGQHAVGAVKTYEEMPYRCIQAHDSTDTPDWTPVAAPSLWANYHATDAKHALPYVQPTGAHDMYLTGEYMVFTDEKVYKCIQDTAYSPVAYPQAWEVVE